MDDDPTAKPDVNVDIQSEKVAAVIYEHLCYTRSCDDESHPIYLSKARFILGTVLVVFAAMSFALSRMSWAVETEQSFHLILLLIIGGLASVVLFAAFICGIQCHRVRPIQVVGVTKLKEVLGSEQNMNQLRPEQTHRDLALNLARTILENREAEKNVDIGQHGFTMLHLWDQCWRQCSLSMPC